MKTLIHIGMPKAGSTALQHALNDAQEALCAQGILYPDPGISKAYNHGLLAGEILPYQNGPRDFYRLSEKDHYSRVSGFLRRMEQQMEEARPDILILSSEYFWRLDERWQLEKLQRLLSRYGVEDIEFLAYVRRPSDFFLSAAQQRLRASMNMTPAESHGAARVLEAYAKFFPQARVTARLFDRSSLIGGDIVDDFLSSYLPKYRDLVLQAVHTVSGNYSLSAEGMALLQDYRRYFFPETDDRFNDETSRFVRSLRKVESSQEAPRPKLRSEFRDFIDYGDAMPLELRDRYGVVFPDFDYARLERGQFAKRPCVGEAVRDAVQVNDGRLRDMIVTFLSDYSRNDDEMINWLCHLPERLDM